VLLDFGDAIVHLFSPKKRDYYAIEGLWSQGVSIVHMQQGVAAPRGGQYHATTPRRAAPRFTARGKAHR